MPHTDRPDVLEDEINVKINVNKFLFIKSLNLHCAKIQVLIVHLLLFLLFAQKQMQSELKNPQKSVFNSKFIIFIFFGSEQIIKDIRIFHKSNK